MLLNYPVFSC